MIYLQMGLQLIVYKKIMFNQYLGISFI